MLVAVVLGAAPQGVTYAQDAGGDRVADQLRQAIDRANAQRPASTGRRSDAAPVPVPSVTLSMEKGGGTRMAPTPPAPPVVPRPVAARPVDRSGETDAQRQFERAKAIAHGLAAPPSARVAREGSPPPRVTKVPPSQWSYDGPGGPAAWASLTPEFRLCGSGQRQSPIHIEESAALQGPNEPLRFNYAPSGATVLHDGRTIRVEVRGLNDLVVRGSSYRLEHLEFKHPAEEVINHAGFAMGVHLVHRNAAGQTAIVAVLLQPGDDSAFIDRVWTYIPLEVGDRVMTPPQWLDVATLLPQDQRYYQFFGSLTQPPCTEGVLWMVLKQPVTLSAEQLRLFAQLFPANARPVQALNGRIVRDAQ